MRSPTDKEINDGIAALRIMDDRSEEKNPSLPKVAAWLKHMLLKKQQRRITKRN